jgi:D-3-phosphoglycerate dehydrogenase/(S)-sulfolactate dehydrogenase
MTGSAPGSTSHDVAVVEDVWGEPFDRLSSELDVARDPHAWQDTGLLSAMVADARALVVRNRTQVDAGLLSGSSRLQVVARAGVGLDNIDLAAADDAGVVVVAALGANAASVAEHALALALAVARSLVPLDAEVRAGQWNRQSGVELAGGTWGLLSAGATARATGRLACALDMTVLAHDPYVDPDDPELARIGIRLVGLEELVARSDVLSVHLPATPSTRGLVGRELLGHARPDLILVNCGRGEVIDEEALADALESRRIRGAGLDVRATEPPVLGRMEQLPNVVLTPHVAGMTAAAQMRIADILCAEIRTILSGGEARYAVTRRRRPARLVPGAATR